MDTPPPQPPLLPQPARKRAILIVGLLSLVLALGVGLYFGGKSLWMLPRPAPVVIASFQEDFQEGQPKNGWRYLWNVNGPIGDERNYADLQWDGSRYGATGSPTFPAPSPARYLRFTKRGGHPGQGFGQGVREVGNDVARYAIAAFTVPEGGRYSITNSRVNRHDGWLGGHVDLRVFVKDREIGVPLYCRSAEGLIFDRDLGELSAGSVIYVAVGPDETDSDDAFGLDFSIAR
jgi:fibronectin-binding autotransporter adhesin